MDFPLRFVQDLLDQTPLAPLISKTVELVKSGKNWKGCCPFHSEKAPSFYVYDDHYHCFGCGEHGDAINFVIKTRRCERDGAIEILAKEANLDMPREEQGSLSKRLTAVTSERPRQPAADQQKVQNKSTFTDNQIEAMLATASRLLVREKLVTSASILANAGWQVEHWEHDRWNGGQDTWRLLLSVPAEVYFELEDRDGREKEITRALSMPVEALSSSDSIFARIVTSLIEDPDWRLKVIQSISGKGVTNQGRVNSGNIATRECDGLLFRSKPEVYFYQALKRTGVPFAPLSVVLRGGLRYHRVEPDFIIYKDGLVMLVEIDGDLYHSETPSAAHIRLKFLTDEGARLERINASACDTSQKAAEAVANVLATIDKLRGSR